MTGTHAMFTRAIVRTPAATLARGLTTVDLGPPDIGLALEQHGAYCRALERCGLALTVLDADPAFPDSTFVEDAAVLTPHEAIITRPGAPSRVGEVASIREALAPFYSRFSTITAPGTLDGGDICEARGDDGRDHFFIGLSHRTNAEGARQLGAILGGLGYTSCVIDVREVPGILHLKSGLSCIGDGTLVVIDALAGAIGDAGTFRARRVVRTGAGEEYGANCVRVNEHVLVPAGLPGLTGALADAGFATIALEMSEFRRMDGGLSCLSLRF